MTHRSTALADIRRADRDRQRRKRERMRTLGIPAPHQVDNAVAEAVAYSLAIALAGKKGIRARAGVQSIDFGLVFSTALDILVRRWRFNRDHAAQSLKARASKRPEHSNPNWTPHFPSCELPGAMDMSTPEPADPPVTPSGHVQTRAA